MQEINLLRIVNAAVSNDSSLLSFSFLIGKCGNYSGLIQINWRLEISECAERFSFYKV